MGAELKINKLPSLRTRCGDQRQNEMIRKGRGRMWSDKNLRTFVRQSSFRKRFARNSIPLIRVIGGAKRGIVKCRRRTMPLPSTRRLVTMAFYPLSSRKVRAQKLLLVATPVQAHLRNDFVVRQTAVVHWDAA